MAFLNSMKTLLIMRHAKSNWNDPDCSDFERPLSRYGLKSAPFMGNIIYKNSIQPNLIISSPAKRAKQTAILVKEVAEVKAQIEFEERIYEASPATLLNVISNVQVKHESVLLIGHNPGIEAFVRILTGETQLMPTASIAKINLNIENWSEITANCGRLEILIRPEDLMEKIEIQDSIQSV
jgi:phosphohistidine phosphatase